MVHPTFTTTYTVYKLKNGDAVWKLPRHNLWKLFMNVSFCTIIGVASIICGTWQGRLRENPWIKQEKIVPHMHV